MQFTENAVKLVQGAEGLRLTAYPDPGTGGAPWTVGWGHTGPEVGPETGPETGGSIVVAIVSASGVLLEERVVERLAAAETG